jgi:hypothetical protein
MKTISRSVRLTFGICTSVALLAGCGGSQLHDALPNTSAPGAPTGTPEDRLGSWMSPEAKNQDLVYVSNVSNNTVSVYGLRKHTLLGQLTKIDQPYGVCSDTSGNVWVIAWGNNKLIEYAHAGTTPVRTLVVYDSQANLNDCSVDPMTGNLAVTNWGDNWYKGDVLIFEKAQGKPKRYDGRGIWFYWGCSYDDRGNLYADGWDSYLNSWFALGVLHKGGRTFDTIWLVPGIKPPFAGTVRWDGSRVAIGNWEMIDEYTVDGQFAYAKRATLLTDRWPVGMFAITIDRGRSIVIAPDTAGHPDAVQYWNYPKGGSPTATITDGLSAPFAAAVSKAGS